MSATFSQAGGEGASRLRTGPLGAAGGPGACQVVVPGQPIPAGSGYQLKSREVSGRSRMSVAGGRCRHGHTQLDSAPCCAVCALVQEGEASPWLALSWPAGGPSPQGKGP